MNVRKAQIKDIDKIKDLLSQVLEIHANIRPDLFIHGTTKYTEAELSEIISNDSKPIYVAVNDNDEVVGYAFCIIENQAKSASVKPFKSIYIDDLCVDASQRGSHIGKTLFEYVKAEAEKIGCYEITLNVWEGNDTALKFYENMGMKVKKTNMEYILDT